MPIRRYTLAAVLGTAVYVYASAAWADPQSPQVFADRARAMLDALQKGEVRVFRASDDRFGAEFQGKWRAERFDLSTGTLPVVDVKRTDSVLDPIQGVLEFRIIRRIGRFRETEEEASRETQFPSIEERVVAAVYIPAASGWKLKSGRWYSATTRSWFELGEDFSRPGVGQAFPYRYLLAVEGPN